MIFTSPLLLWGLLALPLLWILLRAVPPAALRQRFPAVALLLGLKEKERQAERTPWWLMLIRMLALAALILGLAGPILNPEKREAGSGPLLMIFDGTWADASDWARRRDMAQEIIAAQSDRPVAIISLTQAPQEINFQAAEAWAGRLAVLEPAARGLPDLTDWAEVLPAQGFDSIWFSDGLEHRGRRALLDVLQERGALQIYEGALNVIALAPAEFKDGLIHLRAQRLIGPAQNYQIIAKGADPAGIERDLAKTDLHFAMGAKEAATTLDLPPELRNRITRFEVMDQRSAASVSLTDDSLQRRKVALVASAAAAEGLQLLSPMHYLRQALAPSADLIEGTLSDMLTASPDVIVLADVAWFGEGEEEALTEWVEKGGLLLRFAGPKMAAAQVDRFGQDTLLPVQLRQGGRQTGGTLSWGELASLAPFAEESPFYGLAIPDDLSLREQVLAQPDPELAKATLAALEDGTPLVTRRELGDGQLVLFHVTANAEWSNLPLTGLFVQMLERLAVSARVISQEAADFGGKNWQAEKLLTAWGKLDEGDAQAGVAGEALALSVNDGPSAEVPAGIYAGSDRRVAVNVITADSQLQAAQWPSSAQISGFAQSLERSLQGPLLGLALLLLLVDIFASLAVAGRLLAMLLLIPLAQPAEADQRAIEATSGVVLAYVKTGDLSVDELSEEGLRGLGNMLRYRTSIEPVDPLGVDLDQDELAFFPFLYWPITADLEKPSEQAYQKLNQFLRTGGMILFDTRDGDLSGLGPTPEGQKLQEIAQGLDIPPLEVLPEDHVLTRTFYLLQEFPGRQSGGSLWVEAAPEPLDAEEDVPFRNLNDGVTPVVIGGNDWAAAWAMDQNGIGLLPVGRGAAGDHQREIAYRFGINLIMHVLTGNYKSDQVHVPALLERLGE